MNTQSKEWFVDWFDTPYYHTLYKNRDLSEAKQFIQELTKRLPLEKGARVLDLACGKGRHAVTLSECGFDVLGVDLSENSIREAKKWENQNLEFAVHDMREVIEGDQFDGIFNLFTSFGYFDRIEDNQQVIRSISHMLVKNGLLILDFMNVHKVLANLIASETKTVDGITFHIQRRFDGKHIFKDIQFEADGKKHAYTERVQALELSAFTSLLTSANFQILNTYGSIEFEDFDEMNSDRLLIIAQLN
ncbi:MAG: class I SAM-dependent methyltransferase [Flavobacteriales bacterium]|nr:class I SAM-dependent methyltransferase [Flavobacteriales bacterium]